jgi:alkylhydroperoxidase family enzyme
VNDRHHDARRRLEDAVLRGPGHLEARVRDAIARRQGLPEELHALVEKVAREAFRVTEGDFAAPRSRFTEDQVFEAVVSASVGAARDRVEAALRALEDA